MTWHDEQKYFKGDSKLLWFCFDKSLSKISKHPNFGHVYIVIEPLRMLMQNEQFATTNLLLLFMSSSISVTSSLSHFACCFVDDKMSSKC